MLKLIQDGVLTPFPVRLFGGGGARVSLFGRLVVPVEISTIATESLADCEAARESGAHVVIH
eukprot:COSAG01_NODE_928_length_12680_cov_73.441380_5_plen_62_part_00